MKGGVKYDIVVIGLSISSSWGNGHASAYRGLLCELVKSGYNILFLERANPLFAAHRDFHSDKSFKIEFYTSLKELKKKYGAAVENAQLVIVGSSVTEGAAVGEWVCNAAKGIAAFYDIDTPLTMKNLDIKNYEYLSVHLIPRFDLYLSFAGGMALDLLENAYGSPMARPLYCSVDFSRYYPEKRDEHLYDLGYMGTYSVCRQESLHKLMCETAQKWTEGRFAVAGAFYPDDIRWPPNIKKVDHLYAHHHRDFYCSQRFTLNITKAENAEAGYAPSVRLFEAAACGVPIISDYWEGLSKFFIFGEEILLSSSHTNTWKYLTEIPEQKRREIGERARQKVLTEHSPARRVRELEEYMKEALRVRQRKGRKNFVC